ncbi:MAG TPA: lecithin retinol acyltransferase family protein [Pyrinomonadaceae bacterium]|jgi:hypothetical protein|nr:lecithin retinol acyltransferase family protein [Pyrinomonadaceae bacterium]
MGFGDHLYVERAGGLYSHHAIDCGDGTVIHYWIDDLPFRSAVSRTTLEEFADGGGVRVRVYDECDPPDTAVRRALESLGARGFDPLTNNCEHFVVWCKTGRMESSQIRGVGYYLREQPAAAALALMAAPAALPLAFFAVFVGNLFDGLTGETQGRQRS